MAHLGRIFVLSETETKWRFWEKAVSINLGVLGNQDCKPYNVACTKWIYPIKEEKST